MIILAILLAQWMGPEAPALVPPLTLPPYQCTGTGCVSRPIASKLGDVVSVCDFESPCPSLTDDNAAVAAAYAATASGAGAAGACIFFPAGTYKFNLVIDRNGVCIHGSGRVRTADSSPVGGSIFTPASLTTPVIQVGDGTSLVEGTSLSDFSIRGDGSFSAVGTSTSDGLVLLGARNTFARNFEIGNMGGDGIRITSSATRTTVYTRLSQFTVINYGVNGIKLVYGPSFTSAVGLSQYNISPNSVVDTARGLSIEGVSVNSVDGWIQAQNGYKNVYMRYDSQTNTIQPWLYGGNTTMIDSDLNTDVLVNLDMVGTAFNHRRSTQYLNGVQIDGSIKWDVDATVVSMKGTYPNRIQGELEILGGLAFNAGAFDSRDEQSSPTTRLLTGNGGSGSEYVELAGAAFRVAGTPGKGIQFGTNAGHVWRSANGMLRYSPTVAPTLDSQGISVTPHKQAVTYSASMTIDVALGTWAFVTATNGTAFTLNAPTSIGTAADTRLLVTISNTSGGALGAITWNGTFHMAAFTAPGNGLNSTIEFMYDGSNWLQVGTQGPAVAN